MDWPAWRSYHRIDAVHGCPGVGATVGAGHGAGVGATVGAGVGAGVGSKETLP